MRFVTLAFVMLGLVGCGGNSGPNDSGPKLSIIGDWKLKQDLQGTRARKAPPGFRFDDIKFYEEDSIHSVQGTIYTATSPTTLTYTDNGYIIHMLFKDLTADSMTLEVNDHFGKESCKGIYVRR